MASQDKDSRPLEPRSYTWHLARRREPGDVPDSQMRNGHDIVCHRYATDDTALTVTRLAAYRVVSAGHFWTLHGEAIALS